MQDPFDSLCPKDLCDPVLQQLHAQKICVDIMLTRQILLNNIISDLSLERREISRGEEKMEYSEIMEHH